MRIVAGDGRPAALLNITRQIGGNTRRDRRQRRADRRDAAQDAAARACILKPVYDQASLVRDAVKSVRDAMLIGAVLAVIILLLFLRHGRITAISASSIPLTMAITVFVMSLVGQTFNLMTLGAMAIAIGLVIDDAVVITENIVRHLAASRRTAHVAIREAVQELIWPVTTSTITTVVVFLPLGLLTGVEGQFFHALSITLTIAVLVSLVAGADDHSAAERAVPARRRTSTPTSREATRPRARAGCSRAIGRGDRRAVRPLRARARRVAAPRALDDRRSRVVLVVAGVLVAALRRRRASCRRSTRARSCSTTSRPGGTALAETDRQVHIVEQILHDDAGDHRHVAPHRRGARPVRHASRTAATSSRGSSRRASATARASK